MIKSLRLQNFRLYKDATFEFKPGTNLIVGPNGVGKTTIIEAIYATLRGSSWRVGDEVLIRHGQDWARVDIEDKNGTTYSLLLDSRSDKLIKSRLINGQIRKDSPPPIILFEPDYMRTMVGPPDLRRTWLDEAIALQSPQHAQTVKNYKRALFQRNKLLKQPRIAADHLFVWNLKLSEFGSLIAHERSSFIDQLKPLVESAYGSISSQSDPIDIAYQPQFALHIYTTQHLQRLEADFATDRQRGFTSSGPHREDVLIKIRQKPIDEEASRGEIKSIALSLKLSEVELLTSSETIILSDELFEELDDTRRAAITKLKAAQHLATSIVANKNSKSHITKL